MVTPNLVDILYVAAGDDIGVLAFAVYTSICVNRNAEEVCGLVLELTKFPLIRLKRLLFALS